MRNARLPALMLISVTSMLSIPNIQAEEQDHSMHTNHSGHDHTRPDSHAPIGVSGDHLMRDGEFMLTYRYMSMDMDMHMIGAMYAISDKVTLMAMIPYTSISMDHLVNMNSDEFTTDASGIGDVKLAVTYGLFAKPGSDFLFNFAVSAPTGSIDETDDIPVMDNAHLPYPMQLGSGICVNVR